MKEIKNKTPLMLQIEKNHKSNIEEILRSMYVDQNLSIEEISKSINVSYVTVTKWLLKANIVSRRIHI